MVRTTNFWKKVEQEQRQRNYTTILMIFNTVYGSVELIESGPLPLGTPDLTKRNPLSPINVVSITEQTIKIQSHCKNQIVVKNLMMGFE